MIKHEFVNFDFLKAQTENEQNKQGLIKKKIPALAWKDV